MNNVYLIKVFRQVKNVPFIHHLSDFDNSNIPSGITKTIIRLVLFSLSNNKNCFDSAPPVVAQLLFMYHSFIPTIDWVLDTIFDFNVISNTVIQKNNLKLSTIIILIFHL